MSQLLPLLSIHSLALYLSVTASLPFTLLFTFPVSLLSPLLSCFTDFQKDFSIFITNVHFNHFPAKTFICLLTISNKSLHILPVSYSSYIPSPCCLSLHVSYSPELFSCINFFYSPQHSIYHLSTTNFGFFYFYVLCILPLLLLCLPLFSLKFQSIYLLLHPHSNSLYLPSALHKLFSQTLPFSHKASHLEPPCFPPPASCLH